MKESNLLILARGRQHGMVRHGKARPACWQSNFRVKVECVIDRQIMSQQEEWKTISSVAPLEEKEVKIDSFKSWAELSWYGNIRLQK